MARSVTEYRDMMLALLPKGSAWPREPDSEWGKLFTGIAEEFARIDARNEQLLREMNPRSALETLEEWERDYALPGGCITQEQTLVERRNALVEKYQRIGIQSRSFFIEAAAQLGYTITITEYDANNPGPQSNYNGIPLSGDDWNFVWQINAPLTTEQPRIYGSPYPAPYSAFGNELLECTMRALVHDHRVLFFSYS